MYATGNSFVSALQYPHDLTALITFSKLTSVVSRVERLALLNDSVTSINL